MTCRKDSIASSLSWLPASGRISPSLWSRLGLRAHNDSRFDPEVLRRFVEAYQRVQPLTIGELWAVAITLRIVLVENLRRLSEQIVRGRMARAEADVLADNVLASAGPPHPRYWPL